jgi:hypothetical protein
VYNKMELENQEELAEFFAHLRKRKVDTEKIYEHWKSEAIKKYKPGLDIEMYKSLMGLK